MKREDETLHFMVEAITALEGDKGRAAVESYFEVIIEASALEMYCYDLVY